MDQSLLFATNFFYTYSKKPAKDRGRGFTGLVATPTILRLMAHPVECSKQFKWNLYFREENPISLITSDLLGILKSTS